MNKDIEEKLNILIDEFYLESKPRCAYDLEDIRDYIMKKDYEIYKLQQIIDKAIEKYENCKEEDYCTLALDMYDILRGEDNESIN